MKPDFLRSWMVMNYVMGIRVGETVKAQIIEDGPHADHPSAVVQSSHFVSRASLKRLMIVKPHLHLETVSIRTQQAQYHGYTYIVHRPLQTSFYSSLHLEGQWEKVKYAGMGLSNVASTHEKSVGILCQNSVRVPNNRLAGYCYLWAPWLGKCLLRTGLEIVVPIWYH